MRAAALPETHIDLIRKLAETIAEVTHDNAKFYVRGSEGYRLETDIKSGDYSHGRDPKTIDTTLLSDIDITVAGLPQKEGELLPGSDFLTSIMYALNLRQVNGRRAYPDRFSRRKDLNLMHASVYAEGSECERTWEFEILAKNDLETLQRSMHRKGFLRSTLMFDPINNSSVGLPGYEEDLENSILRVIHPEILEELPQYNIKKLYSEIKAGRGDAPFVDFPGSDHPYLDPMSVSAFYEFLKGLAKMPHVALLHLAQEPLIVDADSKEFFEKIMETFANPRNSRYMWWDRSITDSSAVRIKKVLMTGEHTVRAYCQLRDSVFSHDFPEIYALEDTFDDENPEYDLKTRAILAFQYYMSGTKSERMLPLTFAVPLYYTYREVRQRIENEYAEDLRNKAGSFSDAELTKIKEKMEQRISAERSHMVSECVRRYIDRKSLAKEVGLLLELYERYENKIMGEEVSTQEVFVDIATDIRKSMENTRLAPVHVLDLYDAIWVSQATPAFKGDESIEELIGSTNFPVDQNTLRYILNKPTSESPKQQIVELAKKQGWLDAINADPSPILGPGNVVRELTEFARHSLIPIIEETETALKPKRTNFAKLTQDTVFGEIYRRQIFNQFTTVRDALGMLDKMLSDATVAQILTEELEGKRIKQEELEEALRNVKIVLQYC